MIGRNIIQYTIIRDDIKFKPTFLYYNYKHIFVNLVFPLNDSVVFDFKMIKPTSS